MKAVLIEVNSDYSVALGKNGNFIKLNTLPNYNIGDEVDIQNRKKHIAHYSLIAATFVIILNIFSFLFVWAMPYSYISMDVNPSIEITTNRFNYIIKATGVNSDGGKIISRTKLTNQSIYNGIEIILDELKRQNYIQTGKEATLVFAVMCNNQEKTNDIKQKISSVAKSKISLKNSNEVYVFAGNINKYETAKQLNISPGKLMLIEEIQKTNKEVKLEDLKNMKVKDIVKIAKNNTTKIKSNGADTQINNANNSNAENKENNIKATPAQSSINKINNKTNYQAPKTDSNKQQSNKDNAKKTQFNEDSSSKSTTTADSSTLGTEVKPNPTAQPKLSPNPSKHPTPTVQPKPSSGEKPISSSQPKSNSGSGDKSAPISPSKSNSDSGEKSAPPSQSKSDSGSGEKSNSSSQPKSDSGSGEKSNSSSQTKTDSGSGEKSNPSQSNSNGKSNKN